MTDFRALCAELTDALNNLHALVWGECTSLLDEDRGGSGFLDLEIEETLTTARAALAQPAPAVVAVAVSDALIKAECALSDVAEGEPECDDGDPAQWAEQRCAETLAIIRPVMKLHKIRTSEWPPQPVPTPANNTREANQ